MTRLFSSAYAIRRRAATCGVPAFFVVSPPEKARRKRRPYLRALGRTVTFALLCLALTPAFAQPPEIPEVTLRFLFLDESPGAYQLQTGASYRRLSSAPYVISKPVVAKPTDKLKIFKDDLIPDPLTGKKARAQIATVTPPADTTDALVVITPRPVEAGSTLAPVYEVNFIKNDPASFIPGSVRILNLGRAAMAAGFGAPPVIVPSGSVQVVQPVTDARHRFFSRIAIQTAEGWRSLYDTIMVVRPNERITGVFVYSASGLRYTYTEAEIAENGPPPPGHFWLTYSD